MLNFFGIFGDRRPSSVRAASARRRPGKPSGPRYVRPCLEGFEDRVVPAAPVLGAAQAAPAAVIGDLLGPLIGSGNLIIRDLDLTDVNFDAATGLLTAAGGTVSGSLAGLPFTTDITNFALQLVPDNPDTPGQVECSVLDLALGPINLNLLGLHVDTTPICLKITAFEGQGLLGDLLCGLAGGDLSLLNSPDLTGGLSDILGQALRQAAPGGGDESVCTGDCEVLHLTVGPLDLDLLGVNVHLDNCDFGPVEVCVSATTTESGTAENPGGLLGDLLCGLTGTGGLPDLDDLEGIISDIRDILGEAGFTEQQINRVVRQVTRLVQDGNLSLNDIAHLTKTITHLLGKV